MRLLEPTPERGDSHMSVVDDLSEQALALASQEDDDAAVAELVRIAGGDRVADILVASTAKRAALGCRAISRRGTAG
jgi:hypothetical protein